MNNLVVAEPAHFGLAELRMRHWSKRKLSNADDPVSVGQVDIISDTIEYLNGIAPQPILQLAADATDPILSS